MRIALCLLLYPASVFAQSAGPPQDPPPVQSPAQTQEPFVAPVPPASEELQIPAPRQVPVVALVRPLPRTPFPAGYAPEFNASVGYSVTNLGMPSSKSVALSGANASFIANGSDRFGAKIDFNYGRALNVLNSGHGADIFSYLAGPVIYVTNGRVLTTYVDALFGGARVAGPFPNPAGGFATGRVQYPAWAFGGGAEYRLSNTLAYRVGVEYMHTNFYNSSQVVRGQNDIRVVNSIVYYFSMPTVTRHRRLAP